MRFLLMSHNNANVYSGFYDLKNELVEVFFYFPPVDLNFSGFSLPRTRDEEISLLLQFCDVKKKIGNANIFLDFHKNEF